MPQSFRGLGYLRSTWTSELLARELARQHRQRIHASTVRRLLRRLGWVWRRARPTLHIRDPRYPARMGTINRALRDAARADTAVVYTRGRGQILQPRNKTRGCKIRLRIGWTPSWTPSRRCRIGPRVAVR